MTSWKPIWVSRQQLIDDPTISVDAAPTALTFHRLMLPRGGESQSNLLTMHHHFTHT